MQTTVKILMSEIYIMALRKPKKCNISNHGIAPIITTLGVIFTVGGL